MALCFCLRQLTYSYVHMYDSGTNYMSTVHNGKGCYTMYNVMIVMEIMGVTAEQYYYAIAVLHMYITCCSDVRTYRPVH